MTRQFQVLRGWWHWAQDLRLAALERQIRQDPTNLRRRRLAASLYCRKAEEACDMGESSELEKANVHLKAILSASEDARFLHQTLTSVLGPRLFYRLPKLAARYMRKIALSAECLEEFSSRSEFEERATPYHLANALLILKAAGEVEAAAELFEEAQELRWQSHRPITWQSLQQTPAVHIKGLAHQPFWNPKPPLATVLQENHHAIKQELAELRQKRCERASQVLAAYPNLVEQSGVWDMLQLYSGRQWNEDACALLPFTASLLRQFLPSADVPYIHYNTEEVVVFLLTPGTRVRLHNGGSNVPINLSLGLEGCSGSKCEVAGEVCAFEDGKVIAFDDGSDHRVWHDGSQERWVLTVRILHPDLAKSPKRPSERRSSMNFL
ncbi:ASPH [Symbiodinium pilosum]|uniref:ASPH protein n=1 Tax=Symbiodinium pilosum TaxID=2952 RepID=A0A812WN33_SYMPI|nr:ASPH [Symbiodinium pilosum]